MNAGKKTSWQVAAVTATSLVSGLASAIEPERLAERSRLHWLDEYRAHRCHFFGLEFAATGHRDGVRQGILQIA